MALRTAKVSDLLADEVSCVGLDVQANGLAVVGYSYVVGECPGPTPEQHKSLIDRSTALGRLLNQDEVALIVGAEGRDDADD